MTRLVLDANALRRGHFSVIALNNWIDAVGGALDADILIPEVVVWEWAEHAAAAYTTMRGQLQEFRTDPGLYSRPVLEEQIAPEELVERIRALLPRYVAIWTPDPSAWKQAVQEQVLQVGLGERRDGIKTGAADSIVLACVSEQVENRSNAEPVVLATNDRALHKACSRLFGEQVLVTSSTGDLLKKLNSFEPAADELYEETDEELSRIIRSSGSEIARALETFEMGFRVHVDADVTALRDERPITWRDLARLGRIEIVELHDLNIAEREDRLGLADVRVFADVHMTELELQETTPGESEWVTTFDGVITHGFVDIRLAVTFDLHWKVKSVVAAGPAHIVFGGYDEDDENVPPFFADETE